MSDANSPRKFPRRLMYIGAYMAFIFCVIIALMRYAALHPLVK